MPMMMMTIIDIEAAREKGERGKVLLDHSLC
jgi:hypothetical protein